MVTRAGAKMSKTKGNVVDPLTLIDEFGADALRRNLEDLAWLERTARAHQAVLDRVREAASPVPLRLFTIYADDDRVRAMLEDERDVLLHALDRVRDRDEWSVKVLADRDALEAAARRRSPTLAAASAEAEGQAPGRAYLARRKLDRVLHDEARALAQSAAAEVDARLRERAVASTLLSAPSRDLDARAGDVVLNGAYLVERDDAAAFAALVERLGAEQRELGLELALSGPWAAYNFVAVGEDGGP
jgi:hypothetical protein